MDDKLSTGRITEFGFEWGPVTVERCTMHRGQVHLLIKSQRREVVVRVTASGLIFVGEVRKVKR